MEPSTESLSFGAPRPSRSALQSDSSVDQRSQERAPPFTNIQKGAEENSWAFAAELEEIRRLRAARYRASQEAGSHPYPTSVSSPFSKSSSFRSSGSKSSTSCCAKNQENKLGERGGGSEAGSSGSKNASLVSSPQHSTQASNESTSSKTWQSGRASACGSTAGRVECEEIEVTDGDEEGSNISISAPDGMKEFTCPTVKEVRQVSTANTLPIWEDEFDLLTWNLDGLDNEALRPRTRAVVDLIAALRPAVVFLQEVVPSTLAMLRGNLETSYHIYTPSLRKSVAGAATSTSTNSRDVCDIGTGSSRRCSQNAAGVPRSSEVRGNPDFPYFVVILLCIEQMVPLTPEALCEWFPHSHMGRHMLGVVAAPLSRPDDRFLLLTSHLESLREYHVERINQFKRCMRVLTDTFVQDDDDGCSEAGEIALKCRREELVGKEELTRSGRKVEDVSNPGNDRGRKREHDSNNGAGAGDYERENKEEAEKNAREDGHVKKSRLAKHERRGRKVLKGDTSDGHQEGKKGQRRLEVTNCEKRDKRKVRVREIPAFVGIFGGDMNLRDSELQAPAADASKGRIRQQKTRHSRSKRSANSSGSSPNALLMNDCTSETRTGEQTTAKFNSSRAAEGDSLLLPGVEDVWEFLGCPRDAQFTWDMQQNDNKQSGNRRSRLRFDRLYWYGMPAHVAGWKQSKRNLRRNDAPVRLCETHEGVDVERNVATQEASAASEALSSPERAKTRCLSPTEGGRCEDCSGCEGREDELGVIRWTWKPESLRLVGTLRLPSCGRFPSDHFGLLAKFRRHLVGKGSPVLAG